MFHVKHEPWTRAAGLLGVEVSSAQTLALETYESLLLERAVPLGMVASGDREQLRERHILDSIRAAPLLGKPDGEAADLGSGAGLPGIPLAIVRPDVDFRLIDTRRRRVAFLELAVDTLRLTNARVLQRSIDGIVGRFPVCLARALADPRRAWAHAERLLPLDGRLLYWAGKGFDPASGTPAGVHISVRPMPGLADAGPIVIMTRQ
jgi:16S rRNA (guanine527-N7)-methyltransferase